MMTIDKNLVKKAMEESGFTPQLIDSVTHKGFYDDIMSQDDPDSKDVYVLYGVLNIGEKKPNKQAVSKPKATVKKPNGKKRNFGCMQHINKKMIMSMYERKGYNATTFAESCGCRTASNLGIMLSRGSCKWNTILAMSKVLGCIPRDIIIGVCNAANADIVPASFPKELTKNINEFTTEVNCNNFSKLGNKISPSKLAKIMHVPVSLVKLAQVPSSKCKLPISAIQYLCDSGEADLEDILSPSKKEEIKQVYIEDPTPSEKENMEEIFPKNPFAKSNSHEEKLNPTQGQKRFETAFEEFLHNSSEAKKHQEYLEEQHKQESIIRSKSQLLEMKKTEMMHNGMISIDALIKITEMLQQNREGQDLFITLATLPDGKRQHAINALNTLIVSLV